MSFALGAGEVIAGWERALASMKQGELAALEVPPEMAYGEAEVAGGVGPLRFELELLEVLPAAEVPFPVKEDMSAEERLLQAAKEKEEGNVHFKAGSFQEAKEAYLNALYLLGFEADCDQRSEEGVWLDAFRRETRQKVALACQLNLCQCLLKLEEYLAAVQSASAALELDGANSKALYRRGLAQLGAGEAKLARSDLAAAARLEPRNAEIRRSLESCQQRLAGEKTATKEALGGFLSR
ncbi:unnamed protein product [Effrenium voratum]|nr:unnamed protein product [Effrenium voratum]CAJ1398631.1 unnamed protein product [Effrenium voratum]